MFQDDSSQISFRVDNDTNHLQHSVFYVHRSESSKLAPLQSCLVHFFRQHQTGYRKLRERITAWRWRARGAGSVRGKSEFRLCHLRHAFHRARSPRGRATFFYITACACQRNVTPEFIAMTSHSEVNHRTRHHRNA